MAALDPRAVIEEFLDSHDLDFEKKDSNTFLVSLPGEKKLQTHCALVVGDHIQIPHLIHCSNSVLQMQYAVSGHGAYLEENRWLTSKHLNILSRNN